jgi:spermidine synthase/tetratricopeptide (TPR) repeat protein
MVYEVGWFRLLALVVGPSVHAFSMMLAVFLIGVAIGSLGAAKWAQSTRRPLVAMAALEGLIGVATLGSMALYNELPWYFGVFRQIIGAEWAGSHILTQAMIAAIVMLTATLGMGALFPVTVRAFREAAGAQMGPEPNVGGLYVLNTVGGIFGSLAAGFWLLPRFGLWNTLLTASLLSVGLGLVIWSAVREVSVLRKAGVAIAGALATVGALSILPESNILLLNQGFYRDLRVAPEAFDRGKAVQRLAEQTILLHEEGVNASVVVIKQRDHISLRVSGKVDASTSRGDWYTQLLSGQFPMFFARNPRQVAVIGYGSGMTPGTILRHRRVEALDIVEIEQGVMDSSKYFEFLNHNPLADPRTRLILEDGRSHLTYTNKVYDVIVSEPSNPWMAGVSNLFTVDFYKLVRNRLAPDGVFCQWLQLYEIREDIFKTMLASLHEIFPHVAVFFTNGKNDLVVLASATPIQVPWETVKARFYDEAVHEELRAVPVQAPQDLFNFFFAGTDQIEDFLGDIKTRNTDDNVWLEHRMSYAFFTSQSAGLNSLIVSSFADGRLAGLRKLVPDVPLEEAVRAMVWYPYSSEPFLSEDGTQVMADWATWRTSIVNGLAQGFLEEGNQGMVKQLRAWEQEGERLWNARVSARQRVLAISREEEEPGGSAKEAANRAVLKEALDMAPDLPAAVVALAEADLQRGDIDKAEGLLRRGLEYPWSPWYYNAAVGMAEVMKARNRLDEGLEFARLAQRKNPYKPAAFAMEARLLDQQGRSELVVQVLERSLFYNPGDASLVNGLAGAYFNLGQAYSRKGRHDEALTAYQKALGLKPEHAAAATALGDVYAEQGRYDQAIAAYRKAVASDPGSATAYGNMGWAYYAQGDFQKCVEFSEKAVTADPMAFYARYNTAFCYLRLGQTEKAKALYAETKQLTKAPTPDLPAALKDLEELVAQGILVKEAGSILTEVFGATPGTEKSGATGHKDGVGPPRS